MSNVLTDTTTVEPKELVLSALQSRYAFIYDKLFLFPEIKNHGTLQIDSFALSYNPNQSLDNDKVYNLYLRSVLIEADTTVSANTMIVPCAFDLKDLVKQALPSSGSSEEQEIKIRINYVKGFNKDTTSCVWAASDVYSIYATNSTTTL